MARLFTLVMEWKSIDLEKCHRPGLTDRAGTVWLPFEGVAANLANIVINILVAAEAIKYLLVELSMDFLNRVS